MVPLETKKIQNNNSLSLGLNGTLHMTAIEYAWLDAPPSYGLSGAQFTNIPEKYKRQYQGNDTMTKHSLPEHKRRRCEEQTMIDRRLLKE